MVLLTKSKARTFREINDLYTNTLILLAIQGETKKMSDVLPVVGCLVDGGIVDGAVDRITAKIRN